MSFRIVVDENIPLATEAFSAIGEVELHPGRSIHSETVREADALIVRSITRVDENLLVESRVRFVGTATIGTDHVDLDYLKTAGIAFADAAGCNANSVAEYVAAALLDLEASLGTSFIDKTIGIVGVGNVGSKVIAKARALGLNILLNDPPRAQAEGPDGFVDLDRLLSDSDIVTLHTPLQRGESHPTYHLMGPERLEQMMPSGVLLNTGRGSVVDGNALLTALGNGQIAAAVLDVWENEPNVDPQLLEKVRIATPHTAGYSLDGKLAGTRMMVEALARFLGENEKHSTGLFDVAVEKPSLNLISAGREALREAVFSVFPIQEDDRRMKELLRLDETERPLAFDRLRKVYPIRREFQNYRVGGEFLTPDTKETLYELGFGAPRA